MSQNKMHLSVIVTVDNSLHCLAELSHVMLYECTICWEKSYSYTQIRIIVIDEYAC